MIRIALFSIGTIIILFTQSKLPAEPPKHSEGTAITLTSSVPITTSNHFTAPFIPRRVIHVCKSGCDYKLPSQAIANGEDYDLILVQSGTYADCAAVPPKIAHVWIRGFGGMAHMKGVVCEHKAALVVTGTQTVIENFEFSDLHISCEFGQNAVGIRLQAGDLLVHNSYFHDSQGGILTANTRTSNVAVSNSHFARLGREITQCAANPFTWFHNIYIGVEASFTLRNSIVENNATGHLVKSRALKSVLECNKIVNGYDAVYTKNGFLVDLPQGGDERISNNLIAQGPVNSDQQIMVAYGAEIRRERLLVQPNPVQQLEMVGNTLLNDFDRGTFVQMFSAASTGARLTANSFVGPGISVGGVSTSVVEDSDQVYPTRSLAGERPKGLPTMPRGCSGHVGTAPVQ